MNLVRRQFLSLSGAAVAAPALSRFAFAQAYPSKPVRIIVGFVPGSTTDILARLVGQALSERWGQPFIVENRPGASSNIAVEAVVRAPADGYTLLLIASPNAVNATFFDNLKFNFVRDIAPVAGLGRGPLVLLVNPSFPAKTVPEFIAYVKANPGKINIASSGNGTTTHVSGELLKISAGLDMHHVPYRGEPAALTDLVAGQVQAMFSVLPPSIAQIKAGQLRALAVTSTTRSDALPDVAPLSDFVPGFEASGWQGLGAPRGTPTEIIERLNKEVNAAFADAKIKSRLFDLGLTPFAVSPSAFGNHIEAETEKWGKVVRAAKIRAD
jgi:tripartite-type tricarboxylate transporter receptor subunit TctC